MQHTLTNEEYQDLLHRRQEAENEAARLREELKAARGDALALGNKLSGTLLITARASIEIVRFAVANLPPQTIKGWPTKALFTVADGLSALPEFDTEHRDLAIELKAFAREADALERERARR